MNTDTRTRPLPRFWYGLPHGYTEVDLDPTEEGVAELARQLGELPAGVGFLTERVRRTPAPGAPPAGQEEPGRGTVWQGTVAVPESRTSSIVVVQLVTSSVELADDYRSVLLGTARPLSFTDPAADQGRGSEGASGRAARAMESDFG